MNTFLLLSLVVACVFAREINDKEMINDNFHLFNDDNSTYVSGKNTFFHGMNYADAKKLLGAMTFPTFVGEPLDQSHYDKIPTETIPDTFDARQKWGNKILPIRNQAQCGSCWAFSAVEVLGDRFSIQSNGETPVLSAQDLVACDSSDNGCGGGTLPSAWNFLKETGVVSDSCEPYTSGSGKAGSCARSCSGSGEYKKYKAKTSYAITSVENMQKEIMTNGPIQVAFMVYKSFMTYKSGVYTKKWYEFVPEGGHAVKIVGWGSEKSGMFGTQTPYWLVANSWDTTWGLDGYFKIKRGVNACGIEKTGPPYAGMPDL